MSVKILHQSSDLILPVVATFLVIIIDLSTRFSALTSHQSVLTFLRSAVLGTPMLSSAMLSPSVLGAAMLRTKESARVQKHSRTECWIVEAV